MPGWQTATSGMDQAGFMRQCNFSMLDYIPMGAFVLDADYRVRYWNKCLETWTGIRAQDILGQDARARFPRLDQPKIAGRLDGIFQGGPPSIFSAQLHRYIIPAPLPGGHMRLQNTMVNAVASENGYFALFTLQDVTEISRRLEQYIAMRNQALSEVEERRRAEQEIREREALYRSIFEKNRAVKLILDPQSGSIVDANTAACYFYGYPHSRLLRMNISHINVLPREQVRQKMRMAVEETCNVFEFQHRLADGSLRDVEVHSAPIEIGGQNLLYSIIHDITKRKKALEALRQSERTFRDLFEMAGDILLVQDSQCRIIDANLQASETLGYSKQELLGHTLEHFESAPHKGNSARRLAELQGPGVTVYESEFLRKDGSLLPVEVKARSIELRGEPAVLGIARDISARKAMEALREDVERITRHDLKNPLGAVVGLTDILLEDPTLSEEQHGIIKVVQGAGYSMLNMINLSLHLYKMEQGTYAFNPQTVDLRHLVEKIGRELREVLHAKGLELVFSLAGGQELPVRVEVQGEEQLCYSMLFNLLQNAVEASPENATVDVTVIPNNKATRLEIRNQGAVPKALRTSFFDKYSTHGKPHGTGLGTYSARLFAEVQKGAVGSETADTPDRGWTMVWVELPTEGAA